MTPPTRDHHLPLLRKLESIAAISADEREAVLALPLSLKSYGADQTIIEDGDRPQHCCFVISGFLCSYKMLPNGNRTIMAFYVPGDMPDLQSLHLNVLDHSIGTLKPSEVAFVPHAAIHDLARHHYGLASALWRDTLIDAAISREWLTALGRRSGYQRVAHLFCELYLKHKVVGLVNGTRFELWLTQEEMGDALGLSTVHINRVMQELRQDGLIRSVGRIQHIENWERLQAAALFDPTYLHLQPLAS